MTEQIETFELGRRKIVICQDPDPEDPRGWDNLGTMACWHRRYTLGDKNHGIDDAHCHNWQDVEAEIMRIRDPATILPLYLFDHSGLTMTTDPEQFRQWDSHGWDWGQVGFIFVGNERIRTEYGAPSPETIAEATEVLKREVRTYSQYLHGDVYGYEVRDGDGVIDSCWGFYGVDDAQQAAREACSEHTGSGNEPQSR